MNYYQEQLEASSKNGTKFIIKKNGPKYLHMHMKNYPKRKKGTMKCLILLG